MWMKCNIHKLLTYGIETDICEGACFMTGNEKVILDAGHGGDEPGAFIMEERKKMIPCA